MEAADFALEHFLPEFFDGKNAPMQNLGLSFFHLHL